MRRGSSSTGPGPGSGADEVCWTDVTRWFSHGSVYLQRNLDQSTGKTALFSIFACFVIIKAHFCSSLLLLLLFLSLRNVFLWFPVLIFLICVLSTYSKRKNYRGRNLFFSSKCKLEVVGKSVVYTHLVKQEMNTLVFWAITVCGFAISSWRLEWP